jgi:hypothetical protein
MLKLHASFSKKVPTDEAYSSQSYHAAIEIELPDGLAPADLRERIHQTFALVRASVEAELHGGAAPARAEQPAPLAASAPPLPAAPVASRGAPRSAAANATPDRRSSTRTPRASHAALSERQLRFLMDLGLRGERDLAGLNAIAQERYGVASLADLTRQQASDLIAVLQADGDSQRRAA